MAYPLLPALLLPVPLLQSAPEFLPLDAPSESDLPVALAFSGDGAQVVVVHRDTDNVDLFDASTGLRSATLAVGDRPGDVATTADGTRAVVVNRGDDSLSVIDLVQAQVIATHGLAGTRGYQVEVTPDGSRAVVGCAGGPGSATIDVLDLLSGAVLLSFPSVGQSRFDDILLLEEGDTTVEQFTGFELLPDGSSVLVLDRLNSDLVRYDLASGQVLGTLSFSGIGLDVSVSPDGSVAVVNRRSIARVLEVDVASMSVTGDFAINPASGAPIQISADKNHAVIGSGGLRFVDLASGQESALGVPYNVEAMALSADGASLVAVAARSDFSDADTVVVDVASRSVVATLPVAGGHFLAASPLDNRVAILEYGIAERLHIIDAAGAASSVLSTTPTGSLPEGDRPRFVALSPQGGVALSCNAQSGNVSLIDLSTRNVEAWIETDLGPWHADFAPDGSTAVVANRRARTVSVVDIQSRTTLITLPVLEEPLVVKVHPDGLRAFVALSDGIFENTNYLAFIDLAGAASSVVDTLQGLMNRDLELSPDGSTLYTLSHTGLVETIDLATRTRIELNSVSNLITQSMVLRADGSQMFVRDARGALNSYDLAPWSFRWSTHAPPGAGHSIESPIVLDAAEEYVYMSSDDFAGADLRVHRTSNGDVVRSLPAGGEISGIAIDGDRLYVTTDDQLRIYTAAGPGTALLGVVPLSQTAKGLAFDAATRTAIVNEVGERDGLDLIDVDAGDPLGTTFCSSTANSSGSVAHLSAIGSDMASPLMLTLSISGLPGSTQGLIFFGTERLAGTPFGDGLRCAGGATRRVQPAAASSGGTAVLSLNAAAPYASSISAGADLAFQFWFRDTMAGMSGFNTSDGLNIVFQ